MIPYPCVWVFVADIARYRLHRIHKLIELAEFPSAIFYILICWLKSLKGKNTDDVFWSTVNRLGLQQFAVCNQPDCSATKTHMHGYGITRCYLPPGKGDIPASTRFSDTGGMHYWADLQGGPKKWGHRLMTIILSNLNRLKFFHRMIPG